MTAGALMSAIFALRMAGLFMILPVFALYAVTLPGGDSSLWIGIALGAFGLAQALMHIPMGMCSDRFGRRPVIVCGLLCYVAGSLLAAAAPDIYWLVVARVIQGAGAIAAVLTALAADLTRIQHRTKVMAMIGSSIGVTFALSLVLAPPLAAWLGLRGLFLLIAGFAILALGLTFHPIFSKGHVGGKVRQPVDLLQTMRLALHDYDIRVIFFGVFVLHTTQTMLWIVVPQKLASQGLMLLDHWQLYLPALAVSFLIMLPLIIWAERQHRLRFAMLIGILFLFLAQPALGNATDVWSIVLALTLFFIGFNVLEALLPALLSRLIHSGSRGALMGMYNTVQSAAIAFGGIGGGWLIQYSGQAVAYLLGSVFVLLWLVSARRTRVAAVDEEIIP